jgi:putative heme transporter
MTLLCVALVALVPSSSGSSWRPVLNELRGLDARWVLVLTVAWWAGLCSHSFVLTASLPGLTSRRAIGLNLAGSAVANAVPLGGALSMAVTSSMVSSWGFGTGALGAFLTVSTVANLLVRLVSGAAGLLWLTVALHGAAGAGTAGWLALSVLACLAGVGACLLNDRTAASVGATWTHLLRRARRSDLGAVRRPADGLAGIRVRRRVLRLVARSWARLSLGMVVYVVLLGLLLDLALHALGSPMPWPLVLATVAVERLVTAIPVTPGGVGIAELTLTACLVLGGAPPADAAAGALVYRVFTYFIEIPLGLAVTGVWGLARWRRSRRWAGSEA